MDVAFHNARIQFRLGLQCYEYQDPFHALMSTIPKVRSSVQIISPGLLMLNGIGVDSEGHICVTEFSGAGPVPLCWNYSVIEAAVRFDWAGCQSLPWLHQLEVELVGRDCGRINSQNVETPLKKAAGVIQTVRRLALQRAGVGATQYHCGVFFQALRRLAWFYTVRHATVGELTKFGHLLMAASMIAEHLSHSEVSTGTNVVFVENDQEVIINDRRIPVRGQSFAFVKWLFDHANRLCTHQELVERVLLEKYDNTNRSQANRLHTAVRRLRERIEEDPDHPRIIVTEANAGYRLVLPT